jgi:TRAP-type C4-dicarboxylate transport system permease small subunit
MQSTINGAVGWMRRRAENIVAGLLGIMFGAFIIQIVFRYFFNFPIGWTSELSVITWTVSYVAFMKVESSSYLKIRLDILYSIYIVFAVAVIVRYAWAIVSLLRGKAPEEADITKANSGL